MARQGSPHERQQHELDAGAAGLPRSLDIHDRDHELPACLNADELVPIDRPGARQTERDRIVAMFEADPRCRSVSSASTTAWFLSSADQVAAMKKQIGRD